MAGGELRAVEQQRQGDRKELGEGGVDAKVNFTGQYFTFSWGIHLD